MKKSIFLWLMFLTVILFLTGCNKNNNFMDIDNPNAKDDLQNLIGDRNLKKIDTKAIVPDNLSWTLDNAKAYANKYYEESLEWYVDSAKQWLSWTTQKLKWYYNSWVDQLNNSITNKVNWTISWELNKLKLK